MLEKFETSGEVTDAGFRFDDTEFVRRMMRGFKRGKVRATFESCRDSFSNRQRRFWRGVVVPAFAEHCGYDTQEMHDVLMLRLLPVERTDMVTGEIRIVPGHTSDLNTKEGADLIDRAQRLGAEMGIYIPDPGEDVTGKKKGRSA